jgi:serine phosphatase RsbU (regulator of sigma subunit)
VGACAWSRYSVQGPHTGGDRLHPELVREIVLTTATATVYAIVAGVSLLAAVWLRTARPLGWLLAWAMLQHALNEVTGSRPIQDALIAAGAPAGALTLVALVTRYFVGVPWAMLVEQLVGPGWRSSVRVTWIVYVIAAAASLTFDMVTARPGAASGVNGSIVAAGAFVGFANLFVLGPRRLGVVTQLHVLRGGILIALGLVVLDGLSNAGLLPWRQGTGALGVLVCIGAIGYTVGASVLRTRRELHGLSHELATARRIQASILPTTAPAVDGLALAFGYVPAAAVAGDVFEFLQAGPRRIGILVADVSGHGVPAALIASMVKVATAAQQPHADDPARVLAGIHLALGAELPPGHFVTAVYVFVDLEAGVLRHASAGHPPALVWQARPGGFAPAAPSGPLIISFAPPDYPVTTIPLVRGDRVLLYTDGIVEAMRPDDEMFGLDRLQAVVAAGANGPDRLVSGVLEAAAAFTGRPDDGFADDCTIVALEVR